MKLDVQSLSVTLGENPILRMRPSLLIVVNSSVLSGLMVLVKRRY